jgi:hypothetical protein
VTTPNSDEQVKFLVNIQRLLAEGQFVATYKYALLIALADIAVEKGRDDSSALEISTRQIAEKFIVYYWRQSSPYAPLNQQQFAILRQNTGRQAGIIGLVERARRQYQGSITEAQRDVFEWQQLVSKVNQIVKVMPLWKLQTVGREKFDFLYENTGQGSSIQLKPHIAFCLRKFHGLVTDLVRGAWVRYVRRFNPDVLGSTKDLHEFLFGSERADLSDVAGVLREVQGGRCFYCNGGLKGVSIHVDHFVPWSRYPVDLGHNFVLAHQSCNNSKSDRLAAPEHLERWVNLIEVNGKTLTAEFDRNNILNDLDTSIRITGWAYQQTSEAGGMTWIKGNQLQPLTAEWEDLLARMK